MEAKKLNEEVVRLQWKKQLISGCQYVQYANNIETVVLYDLFNKFLKIFPQLEAIVYMQFIEKHLIILKTIGIDIKNIQDVFAIIPKIWDLEIIPSWFNRRRRLS